MPTLQFIIPIRVLLDWASARMGIEISKVPQHQAADLFRAWIDEGLFTPTTVRISIVATTDSYLRVEVEGGGREFRDVCRFLKIEGR